MVSFILFDFCSLPWWMAWILPFLLGLLLGWALWAKYQGMLNACMEEKSSLQASIKNLESSLHAEHSKVADLEGDLALARGKEREAEYELEELKKSMATQAESSATSSPGQSSNVAASSSFASAASESVTKNSGDAANPYAALKNDNLQIIEGIGPKMEEVLKENGISSWADLSTKSEADLRTILDKYGDQYKIIDPRNWPGQAAYAVKGDWNGLIKIQQEMEGGLTDSKLQKLMIKMGLIKNFKQDDLKIVEGIGPKIEELLHNAGIKTWATLASTSPERLKEILQEGGARFQIADPTTWPKQAGMANQGKWDELREYQDFLDGGRE